MCPLIVFFATVKGDLEWLLLLNTMCKYDSGMKQKRGGSNNSYKIPVKGCVDNGDGADLCHYVAPHKGSTKFTHDLHDFVVCSNFLQEIYFTIRRFRQALHLSNTRLTKTGSQTYRSTLHSRHNYTFYISSLITYMEFFKIVTKVFKSKTFSA
jgi:hypothetical protein